MRKAVFTFLIILSIGSGIAVCLLMMNKEKTGKHDEKDENIWISEKVTDECIDEYENINLEPTEETNSQEIEKISPNATVVFQEFYKGCEHIKNKYEGVKKELVNATKEDVKNKYFDWQLKNFSPEKIILYKEVDGECGEHYMLRDVGGKINVYQLDEEGNETLLEETDIATKYLTQIDMIDMENGLIVYGKESLNQLLEDFE